MSSIRLQREAFNEVCQATYRGLALTFVQCCRCGMTYAARTVKVNGFNEWAYRREPQQVQINNQHVHVEYMGFEHHACCSKCTMDTPRHFGGGFAPGLLESLYPEKLAVKQAASPVSAAQLADIPDPDDDPEECIF